MWFCLWCFLCLPKAVVCYEGRGGAGCPGSGLQVSCFKPCELLGSCVDSNMWSESSSPTLACLQPPVLRLPGLLSRRVNGSCTQLVKPLKEAWFLSLGPATGYGRMGRVGGASRKPWNKL